MFSNWNDNSKLLQIIKPNYWDQLYFNLCDQSHKYHYLIEYYNTIP